MRGLLLLCVLLSGCAARTAPRVVNLDPALANTKATWFLDTAGQHLYVKRADGALMTCQPTEADATWAETWIKAQATVPKPAPEKQP